jgi:hypothetical protein
LSSWLFPDARLIIFAKAPRPGQVKTRLLSALNSRQAAELQRHLILRTLAMVHSKSICPVQLWCTPDCIHPVFTDARDIYGLSLHDQCGHDLGDRMHYAISACLEQAHPVLLMGCDCVSLTCRDLVECLEALNNGHQLALGPAEDGGYVLIGMSRAHADLFFDMQWGTNAVLEETRCRARQLGLHCFETIEQWDIDRPADLHRLLSYGNRRSEIEAILNVDEQDIPY